MLVDPQTSALVLIDLQQGIVGMGLAPLTDPGIISLAHQELTVPKVPFQLSQVVVGCMIARTITWSILVEIGHDWPIFISGVLSVILLSRVIGWFLTR